MEIFSLYNDAYLQNSYNVGNKAYNLYLLNKNGFNVPPFITLKSVAFDEFLNFNNIFAEVKKHLKNLNPNNYAEISLNLQNIILDCVIPDHILESVIKSVSDMEIDFLAIRSSGLAEDNIKTSMAGMHSTYLDVSINKNEISNNIKKCWASLFNKRAISYRISNKLSLELGMAVIIQKMIKAKYSGVVFTKHPKDNNMILIEYTLGNSDKLVNGQITPHSLKYPRNTTITNYRLDAGELPLNIFFNIVSESVRIENLMKYPQDIEWCLDQDFKLWFLQTRAITVKNTFTSIF